MRSRISRAIFLIAAVAITATSVAAWAAGVKVEKGTDWFHTLVTARAQDWYQDSSNNGSFPDFSKTDFTIAGWIRTTGNGIVFSRMPVSGRDSANRRLLFVRGSRLCFDAASFYVEAGGRVDDGQWHHFAVVREMSSKNVTCYVDGQTPGPRVFDNERDGNIWPDMPEYFLRIGCAIPGNPDSMTFAGDIDELCLFKRCLSAEEVAALASAKSAAPLSALVARWSFDGTGMDASGNGFDAGEVRNAVYAEGKVGQAVHLDGSGRVGIPINLAQKVWYTVEDQFPDAASRQEMEWELGDGIWFPEWKPGDWQEAANRYARLCTSTPEISAQARDLSKDVKDVAAVEQVRKLYLRSKRRDQVVKRMEGSTPDTLRKGIAALGQQGVLDADKVKGYLSRLDGVDTRFEELQNSTADAGGQAETQLLADIKSIQQEAFLQNKLFDFDKLVFVERYTFQSNHYYTDFINGCAKFGGNLCVLSLKDGSVKDLAPELKDGIFGRIDLSWDAQKVAFAWKTERNSGFRIYEVGIDGTGLRQVLAPPENEEQLISSYRVGYHHGTDDMDPCYMPDGSIVFISTRCQYGILCDSPDDFTTTVLYKMDADGKNLVKLSNSSVSEASPTVMNDGRILYTRWEYVDKGSSAVKCLWAMRPDGSGSMEIYGNDINYPPSMINARAIPGVNDQFCFVGAPHFPGNRVGTIIRIDGSKDIRTREPMTYITPVDVRGEGGWVSLKNGDWQGTDRGPLYAEPYPLTASTFLVSYNPDKFWADFTGYGLYLLDDSGNHVKIYADPEISCWQPIPVKPRQKPKTIQTVVNKDLAAKKMAAVVVTNIYKGMENVKPGEVKYIRINEQMPRPWAARRRWDGDLFDQQHACISKHGALGLRVQYGVVPVEADGSAYFMVPADRNVFLQALDANFMEVQRERTYVDYKPGEVRSCTGCHERTSNTGPESGKIPLALRRAPSMPGPQPGEKTGRRPLYYPVDVQSVLDKHCVSCHSGADPAAKMDLTGEMTDLWTKSYESFVDRGMLPMINEVAPKCDNISYLPPKSLGSYSSKLVQLLLKGHHNVKLSLPEMVRITTWVDANGQFYGSYYGRRNLKYKGMPDFRPVPTFEMAISNELPAELKMSMNVGRGPSEAPAQDYAPPMIGGKLRHSILVADHSGGGPKSGGSKLRMFSADGKVTWEYPAAGNVHDIWVLKNGNVLFTGGGAVTEVTPDKKIVFQYKQDTYLTACQRLPNGNTMIGDNPANRLIEVDPKGKIVKTVQLSTSCTNKDHQFRLARKLANGHYLVAHEGEGAVKEYDANGKVLKSFKVPGTPYAVVRLKNGNTLVSCGEGKKVIELDPAGKTVWEVSAADVPLEFDWMAGVQRLPNGNTVMTSWFGGNQSSARKPQIFEVTRDKKVMWTFSAPDLIASPNNVVLLDVRGDASKFEILR